jgi:hypothetical protein
MVSIRRDRHDHPRSRLSDREMRATIVSRLRENPYTQDGRIKVTVHDGVVRLTGQVPSSLARTVAGEAVETVPGVADVEIGLDVAACVASPPELSRLTVRAGTNPPERTSDRQALPGVSPSDRQVNRRRGPATTGAAWRDTPPAVEGLGLVAVGGRTTRLSAGQPGRHTT